MDNPYENIKHGAFRTHFKNRKQEYRNIKSLKDWSHFILKNPHLFNKISHKRALFYKNLIEKHNKPSVVPLDDSSVVPLDDSSLTGGKIKHFYNYYQLLGGKLTSKEFELMLKESYKPENQRQNVGDYIIDKSLSTPENVVYYNPKTKETKNVYRGTEGTLTDWGNNALYAVGLHKYSNRYKRANEIEKKVEEKYGTDNLDVLSHSQSGAFTQEIGKNAKNVIALNPATHPLYTPTSKNTTVVRSKNDVVSGLNKLNPFNWGKKANVEIKGKTHNILTEHSPDVLSRLPEDTILGQGRRKRNYKKKV